MRSLLVALTAERAAELVAVFRGEGFEVDVRIVGSTAVASPAPIDYSIVFLDRAIGVEAIREACRPFAGGGPFPLIAVLGADVMTNEQVDELIGAGVNVQLGGESPGLASRVRFLRHALQKRGEAVGMVRASEERYRTVIAALDEGLVVQDEDGSVIAMNPRAGEILGMTDEGVRDRMWRSPDWELLRRDGSLGGPEDLPGMKALTAGQAVRGYVVGARKKSGGPTAWISANAHLVRDASGQRVIGVVTSFSDITERRQAEDEFRDLLSRTPDAVFIHRNERCIWATKRFADLLGYEDPRVLTGVSLFSIVDPRYHDLVAERLRLQKHTAEDLPALEVSMVRSDGTFVDVAISGAPTMYEGEPASIAFTRDRTAQRRLEMELMSTERLAALGRLAAGVGHEINNPLAYVMGNMSIAAERLRKGEDASGTVKLLDEALEGAERVRAIVRDLKVFATRKPEDLATVDVHRVIDSCARMADTEIRHRARLVRVFGTVPGVRANEARLAQVLLNLLLNAVQAIPEGRGDDATITVETRLEADGRVAIDVKDTGTGIAPEHLPHVFEPFFTTKGERGTGLGLSICHMLVAAQGGELTIESHLGRGSCLTIRLLPGTAPEVTAEAPLSPAPATKRRRVLVVDDEIRIARWICDALGEFEHEVSLASSAQEALACIESSAPFDAIVCDLMMPDLSGMDLHVRVQSLRPGLERRMVFMTGGAFTPRAIRFLAENTNPCVEKPFELAELTQALDRLEAS